MPRTVLTAVLLYCRASNAMNRQSRLRGGAASMSLTRSMAKPDAASREHGEHAVPGKGPPCARTIRCRARGGIAAVERGLAGAGCKQHGEAPVFPAVDFSFCS